SMLLAKHFNVTIACNLLEMQACLAQQKFDLALLDLKMSDGHPCRHYREVLKKEGVLILIVAATMTDAELFDCFHKGVYGYAPKD
ncbi:PleD family two-component system response regulator, partial [Propionibacterium freudenreichii]|uniref:hypothetical protein n=1 Tax=Propionibacterium freudenreichii TaxID=1744 RepID=UPI0038533EA0